MQTVPVGSYITCKYFPVKYPTKDPYPQSRSKHATCLHEGYVYLIAGKDSNISLRDFWRFHPGTLKWEKVSFRGDIPHHLEGHTLVSCKKLMLLFGGEFGDANTESSLWIINPDLNLIRKSCLDAGSDRPCVRRHHTSVVYQGCMYMYGGYVDMRGSSSQMWHYLADEEEWELVLPCQPVSETPGGRYGHTAVVHNKQMWVYGGMSDLTPKQDLWMYDFSSCLWERIKYKYGPPALTGHTAVVAGSNMILFGGETNREPVNQIWSFCFKTEKWTQILVGDKTLSCKAYHSAVMVSPNPRPEPSVKASSMPYLQKKMHQMRLERPRSSPGVRSESSRGLVETNGIRNHDQDMSESSRSLNDMKEVNSGRNNVTMAGTASVESLKVIPSSAENVIDKSPLLPKRTDLNYNLVEMLNRNVVNGGIDNPAISKSTEELIHENYLRKSNCDMDIGQNQQSVPSYYRTVSAEEKSRSNYLHRQNTDSCLLKGTSDVQGFSNEGNISQVNIKKIRLDPELVLEDLEHMDCDPGMQIMYPSKYCSRIQSNPSLDQQAQDSDGIETIVLTDYNSRSRSRSCCDSVPSVSYKGLSDCVQYNSERGNVYIVPQSAQTQSCVLSGQIQCRENQYKGQVAHEGGDRREGSQETSFQSKPPGRPVGRYTKHAKAQLPVTIPSEPPYLLIIGGKEKGGVSFSIKPLQVWKLQLHCA